MFTTRSVAAGEELSISYTDVNQPLAARRKALKDLYHFECGCARCVMEADAGGAGGTARGGEKLRYRCDIFHVSLRVPSVVSYTPPQYVLTLYFSLLPALAVAVGERFARKRSRGRGVRPGPPRRRSNQISSISNSKSRVVAQSRWWLPPLRITRSTFHCSEFSVPKYVQELRAAATSSAMPAPAWGRPASSSNTGWPGHKRFMVA